MSGKSLRFVAFVIGLPLLLPLTACFMAVDLVNPAFVSALGVDPATVIPSQGRLVIAFNNATQYDVAAAVAAVSHKASPSASDFTTVAATDIPANETHTMVVDCPVQIVVPGGMTVLVDGAAADALYTGSPMLAGEDFRCGDVIEIQVVEVGASGGTFEIRVRVLAGR